MASIDLKVTGMHCVKCDARVNKAVSALEGVESVVADHEKDLVSLAYDGRPETLANVKEAITALDFVVCD